jgi:hypothetical protein
MHFSSKFAMELCYSATTCSALLHLLDIRSGIPEIGFSAVT